MSPVKTAYAKAVSVSLSRLERRILKAMKRCGATSSMSEAARFCIFSSWEKLQDIIEKGEVIISKSKLAQSQKSMKTLPNIIYVRSGRKYVKYQKCQN